MRVEEKKISLDEQHARLKTKQRRIDFALNQCLCFKCGHLRLQLPKLAQDVRELLGLRRRHKRRVPFL